jgi:hypothetical protein
MNSKGWLQTIAVAYLIFANSIVLIVVVLLGIFAAWWTTDGARTEGYSTKDYIASLPPVVRTEYGHLTDTEVNELLSETWNIRDGGWVYEQWTGFRERARSSKFVNVNELGIRSNGSGSTKFPSLNGSIWMFGGSTTFGYGVADGETIPAYLQKVAHRDVVNFGRGYYYSAQENILLEQLLAIGFVPSKVVFLDGINERCDIDVYQAEMAELFNTAQVAGNWISSNLYRPVKFLVYKALLKVGGAFGHRSPIDTGIMRLSCSRFGAEAQLSDILRANLSARALLCRHYDIECVTFVQPFAGAHGIHADAASLAADARDVMTSHYDALKGVFAAAGAVSIVDALDSKASHAYVDNVHYSASANQMIAESIASNLGSKGARP